jgi:importin subunit alpha-1
MAGDAAAAAAPARPQPSVHEIPQLFMNIQTHDPNVVLEATRGFRRLLSLQKDPPITEVVETGVVPMFVR